MSTTRIASQASSLIVFISSVIVLAITCHFLNITSAPNTHVIYQATVAAATFPLFLGYLLFPQFNHYPLHTLLANIAFLGLWLASFVLAAKDWTGGRCGAAFPQFGRCGEKKAVVAFTFLAFFFILVDGAIKGVDVRNGRGKRGEKHQQDTGLVGSNGAGTAA